MIVDASIIFYVQREKIEMEKFVAGKSYFEILSRTKKKKFAGSAKLAFLFMRNHSHIPLEDDEMNKKK